jgi:hypothetical protein
MFRLRSYRHQGTKRVSRNGEQVVECVDMEPVVLYKGIKGETTDNTRALPSCQWCEP